MLVKGLSGGVSLQFIPRGVQLKLDELTLYTKAYRNTLKYVLFDNVSTTFLLQWIGSCNKGWIRFYTRHSVIRKTHWRLGLRPALLWHKLSYYVNFMMTSSNGNMETFSALLAICSGIHRSPVNSSQRPVTRSFDFFFWSAYSIYDWINNDEAGDLIPHRAHYDLIVI